MRQIILDTETTGLEPNDGHRIVEIGAVEIAHRRLTGNHLHLYVNPGRDSDPEALQVHGLTTEFLAEYPPFEDIAAQLVDFVRDAEIIIHNAPFDVRFLDAELQRCGYEPFETYCGKITDSLSYARETHPGKRNNLDALCERYGISNAHRTLHGALLDAELLADVWLAMTRGQESLLMSTANDGPDLEHLLNLSGQADARPLPVITPSEQETAAHQQYMGQLEKELGRPSLWRKFFD